MRRSIGNLLLIILIHDKIMRVASDMMTPDGE